MKNVVITGVSQGLGKSLFDIISSENANLIAIGRHFNEEQRNAGKILIEHDYCNQEDDYLDEVGQSLIPDEVTFINNAGTIDPIGKIGNLDMVEYSQAIQINCLGPAQLINFLVSFCQKNNHYLTIINISTGAAVHPIAGWAGYCSTKAAIRMFLDVLQEQEKESGRVRIIHVDPGVMDTGMQAKIRSVPASDFPKIDEFVEYKNNGVLRKPLDVAKDIVEKYVTL